MNNTQPLLFDIPSIAETGVWCTLADGIDPAQWAGICRKVGQMSPNRFAEVMDFLADHPQSPKQRWNISLRRNPDSLFSRLKRVFCFNQEEVNHLPLVSIGPGGLKNC